MSRTFTQCSLRCLEPAVMFNVVLRASADKAVCWGFQRFRLSVSLMVMMRGRRWTSATPRWSFLLSVSLMVVMRAIARQSQLRRCLGWRSVLRRSWCEVG